MAKKVHVKSYTKQDGTKVRSHNRNKPKTSKHSNIKKLDIQPKLNDSQLMAIGFYPTSGIDSDAYVDISDEYVDLREDLWIGSGIQDIAEVEGIDIADREFEEKMEKFYEEVDKIMEKHLNDYAIDGSGSEYFGSMNELMYVILPLASKDAGNIEGYDPEDDWEKIDDYRDNIENAQVEVNALAIKNFPFLKKYMDKYQRNVGYYGYSIY